MTAVEKRRKTLIAYLSEAVAMIRAYRFTSVRELAAYCGPHRSKASLRNRGVSDLKHAEWIRRAAEGYSLLTRNECEECFTEAARGRMMKPRRLKGGG
jgi:hypothetical protein